MSPTLYVSFLRDSSGGSQGLRVTAFLNVPGRKIKADVDETGIDRQELLAWSIQTLMAAAAQAKQQKNPGAVVTYIKQLDWMTGSIQ